MFAHRSGVPQHGPRRRLSAGVLAAVVVTAGGGCTAIAGQPPPPPLVIAADFALTGPGSDVDGVYHEALLLRAEQVNRQRRRGGLPLVELEVFDNRGDPAASTAQLVELATDRRAAAVVTGRCGRCVVDAAEQIDAGGLPVVSLSPAAAVVEPVDQRRYVFQVVPHPAVVADVLAAELARTGAETVAVVAADDLAGGDAVRELTEAATAHRFTVATTAVADPFDEQAVAGAAERVAGWRPEPAAAADPFQPAPAPVEDGADAVVVWLPPAAAVAAAGALSAAGWVGQLWLAPPAAGQLTATGEQAQALDGARLLAGEVLVADTTVALLPHQAARRQWFDTMVAAFGDYHAQAGYAADALDLLLAAFDEAGPDVDRAGLRDLLETTHLSGLAGAVRFSPANHAGAAGSSLVISRFRGDRWHTPTRGLR